MKCITAPLLCVMCYQYNNTDIMSVIDVRVALHDLVGAGIFQSVTVSRGCVREIISACAELYPPSGGLSLFSTGGSTWPA